MPPADRSAPARRLRGLAPAPRDVAEAPTAKVRALGDDEAAGGWVPSAIRRAADEYGRVHPDPADDMGEPDDGPLPGGVRRSRDVRRVRWAVSWRVAGTAALAVALVVGAAVLRSVALAPGAAVELPEPSPPVASSTPAPSSSAGPTVVVDVVGAVVAPGVMRLPAGSRVVDALAAAGGATADADLARLNLARVLADGEQVVVPRPGDPEQTAQAEGSGAATVSGGLVDLNTASPAELDELPGVGPVLAQRIVDRRPFASVDELDEVSGVGPTLLERLRPLVTV